jgi:hypothetical protein
MIVSEQETGENMVSEGASPSSAATPVPMTS